MKHLPSPKQLILAPLLVMLLLTLLVGGTAYQVTRGWGEASNQVLQQATRMVILNNIRWHLTQVHDTLRSDPEKATHIWTNTQDEVRLLAELSSDTEISGQLARFMENDQNIHHIDAILAQDFFTPNLKKLQTDLEELQTYSRYVTMAVTGSMVVLGLLLMGITARDLNRLIQALVQSRDLNTTVQEEERRRIAQELHDGIIQELVALKRNYSPEKTDQLVEQIRRICHNLKPQVLEDLGLTAALEFLADELRHQGPVRVGVHLDAEQLKKLPRHYELPLFRVIQELFSNIKQHAQASQVTLTLVYHPEESPWLRGYVQDNGKGFHPTQIIYGLGLTGVRERIQQLGGRITIESSPQQGSQFQFAIPIEHHESPPINPSRPTHPRVSGG